MRWAKVFCDMLDRECPGCHLLFLDELKCHLAPVMLFLDRHTQTHIHIHTSGVEGTYTYIRQELKAYMLSRRVIVVIIPGGCTDVLQPVDMHFGAELKRLMTQFYKV